MTNESKRDWENFFKPEDFGAKEWDESRPLAPQLINEILLPQTAAKIANEIIRKELEKAPRVYGCDAIPSGLRKWYVDTVKEDTHTARLICIEEIKK